MGRAKGESVFSQDEQHSELAPEKLHLPAQHPANLRSHSCRLKLAGTSGHTCCSHTGSVGRAAESI